MAILIKNIQKLVQVEKEPVPFRAGKEMQTLHTVDHAFLLTEGDYIVDFGSMDLLTEKVLKQVKEPIEEIDATGKMVFPSFCDSHTHIVYAGSREVEYIDKIKGLSYEEIAKRGGGINNSAKRLAEATEDELFQAAMNRLEEMASLGTGAVEIKSGYGLNTENELKMLRVIQRLKEHSPIIIKSNFLGAHAVPLEYKGKQTEYVDLIINEMIPMVAAEDLADYIDVFCDKGFFTPDETERILMQGIKYGMRPKIHANELDYSGGIQVGVKYNALSVDHLEYTGDDEIEALLNTETMPTFLPGAAFFLGMIYGPVRKMMDAGLPIALASDFNPGSSPSGNMQLILSMGCVNYKMLPEEAINATTLNSAYAMGVSDVAGSIAKGKYANFFITKPIPTVEFMPYSYGSDKVEQPFLKGKRVNKI
ncbi:MAG: imidazolonepropionase [Bacteroidetes bacterium]|nr:imidazolonepropionase [Bacteroidota bacterium]